jgi:nucleotide-binding universal stress UspA family protein
MKTATKNILVPLDFSTQSLIALEQSYNLAQLSESEITLLHVVRENNAVFGLFSEKEQEDVLIKLQNKLEEFARVASQKSGVVVHTIINKGAVVDKIIETAENINARFIVMGSNRPENMMKKVIGSTALKVIKEAKCPVISIEGRHHRDGCENIILPLDLTKETTQKVAHAINFAKFFKSKIHAVSVVTTKDDYLISRLELQLEQVKRFVEKSEIQCETKMLKVSGSNENISNSILDYANEMRGDLIVIMTQQENDIVEYFVGSLAKEIIHKSKIPVMSIVPKKK